MLTMKNDYATVCGFTEEELLETYKEDIEELAEEIWWYQIKCVILQLLNLLFLQIGN